MDTPYRMSKYELIFTSNVETRKEQQFPGKKSRPMPRNHVVAKVTSPSSNFSADGSSGLFIP